MTMLDGTAMLNVPQTGNIGRGCRFTYDTNKYAFVKEVISSTQFVLQTPTGGVPSNEASPVTVNSIAHEYSSVPGQTIET